MQAKEKILLFDEREVQEYFQQNLREVEERAPSDAVVVGHITIIGSDFEAAIQVSSAEWQARIVKKDMNAFIAIDMATSETHDHILQKRDEITWELL